LGFTNYDLKKQIHRKDAKSAKKNCGQKQKKNKKVGRKDNIGVLSSLVLGAFQSGERFPVRG
jgi:hypothetical protein